MTFIQSLFLSVTQGITEFLPISSSGHLHLIQYFLGLETSLTFDIFLNTASLLSALFFFRHQLKYFFSNLKYIVVGTLPAVIIGLFFKNNIEALFASVKTLPYEFIFTGIILISTKYIKPKDRELSYYKAFGIGLLQALAIVPAISRSGSTIFGALLFGLSPLSAFNFSFSLFIPASIGALILDLRHLSNLNFLSYLNIFSFTVTFFVSLVSLSFLQKVMTGRQIWKFGYYALFLGLLLFFIL